MQSKIFLKRPLLIVSVVVIASVSIIIFFLVFDLFSQGFYTKPASFTGSQSPQNLIDIKPVENIHNIDSGQQANFGLPVRINIPTININAAIERVGVTAGGAMDVPKSQDDAAWLDLGPRPGENGSAVIAGHYGGKISVFNNLYKLRKGDKIYVEDDKGAIISFVVRESRRYDPKADASSVFASNDGKPHLNLVTCEGVWDKVSKSYSKRLVVFADKE